MGRVHESYKTFWTPDYWQAYCEGHPVRRYRGQRERQLMLQLLSLRPGQRFLEAGCGYGRLSRFLLQDQPLRWTGVDLSPVMARHCRDHLPGAAAVVNADVSRLPFANDSFDRVLCSGVLMHLENEEAALAELVRVARPGGLLVITGNNLVHPLGPLVQLSAWLRSNYIQRFHLAGFYRRRLERLGCRLLAVKGDTLLGVGVQVVGGLQLPPGWSLPVVSRIDSWCEGLLPVFAYELWFQAQKL